MSGPHQPSEHTYTHAHRTHKSTDRSGHQVGMEGRGWPVVAVCEYVYDGETEGKCVLGVAELEGGFSLSFKALLVRLYFTPQ